MRRAPAITVLITLVLCLPMVTFTGTILLTVDDTPSTGTVLSQEPGTRLDPEDHTAHVPILIDEDSDFVSQGWPGSGTAGDPYIISGLNITYDLGFAMVRVYNTDKNFVIRDCFINQLSSSLGIEFINTTHAHVEYTTVVSGDIGIYAYNANNTEISHTDVLTIDYAVSLESSESCALSNNLLNSTGYRSVIADYCDQLVLLGNVIQSEISKNSITLNYCFNVSSNDDTIYGGYAAFWLTECNSFSVVGLYTQQNNLGFYADNCSDLIVDDSMISTVTSEAVYLRECDAPTITDSHFTSTTYIGIHLRYSNDSLIMNNFVNGTGTYGMLMYDCYEGMIDHNEFSNIGGHGIYVLNVEDIVLSNNTVHKTTSLGIYGLNSEQIEVLNNTVFDNAVSSIKLENTHDSDIMGNKINNSLTYGIEIDQSDNITVIENAIEECDTGIYLYDGENTELTSNMILGMDSIGVISDLYDDSSIIDNTITRVGGTGIRIATCDRVDVTKNYVSYCGTGISSSTAVNVTISDNLVEHQESDGIYLEGMINPVITDNIVSNCTDIGISMDSLVDATLSGNNLTLCGFLFVGSQAMAGLNHTLTDNRVNDKPLYYGVTQNSLLLNGADYGQFILVNCTHIAITGGVFNRTTLAFQLHTSHWVEMSGFTSLDNLIHVMSENCNNMTVEDAIINGFGEEGGIGCFNNVHAIIDNITVSNLHGISAAGVFFVASSNVSITNSNFTMSDYGMVYFSTPHSNITDCQLSDIRLNGILIRTADYTRIERVSVYNATEGIYADDCLYVFIEEFTAVWCEYGIFAESISGVNDFWNVSLSYFHDNTWGMYLDDAWTWDIYNNTIVWNNYGIELVDVDVGTIFFNMFAMNTISNGYDNSLNNWDDHVDTGNYWADYSPPGTYTIDGLGAEDRYPMTFTVYEPLINTPKDIWYAEGSEGNEIVWLPFDDSPRDWKVYVDDSLWDKDIWNFYNVTVNIDGLAYGTHEVKIIVWDVDQNNVTDTVIVHVYDDTPPEIDGPPNMDAFVDVSGQEIVWEVSDLNPDTYTVYDNGEEYTTGSWTSGDLAIDIDGLDEGLHTIVIIIYDISGSSAKDTVLVQVIDDDTDPSIDSPADLVYTYGTTGNRITWSPSDDWPASYEIEENNTLLVSGDWGGSRIVLDVDGLIPGSYEFTITVFDRSGNSATDAVNVTVIGFAPTTTTEPVDYTTLILIGAAVGGIILVIAAALYIRKRRST